MVGFEGASGGDKEERRRRRRRVAFAAGCTVGHKPGQSSVGNAAEVAGAVGFEAAWAGDGALALDEAPGGLG